jgi:hypothetical protein
MIRLWRRNLIIVDGGIGMNSKLNEPIEDSASAPLIALAVKERAAGAPLIPKTVVDSIVNGNNVPRTLKERRSLTQRQFSAKVKIERRSIFQFRQRPVRRTADA